MYSFLNSLKFVYFSWILCKCWSNHLHDCMAANPVDVFQKNYYSQSWRINYFFLFHLTWKRMWSSCGIFRTRFFAPHRTNHLYFFHRYFFFIAFVMGLMISKRLCRKKGRTIECVIGIFVFFVEKEDCLCSWIIDFKIICCLYKIIVTSLTVIFSFDTR